MVKCRHGLPGGPAVCALCREGPQQLPMPGGGPRVRSVPRRAAAPPVSAVSATPPEPCPRCLLPSEGGEVCLPCSRLDHFGAPDGWLAEGLAALCRAGRTLAEWAEGRQRGRIRIVSYPERISAHAGRLARLAEVAA
jgi:hypothetical protein